MKISDYLKEDMMILDLDASEKNDAIKELANVFSSSDLVTDFKLLLNDIYEREELSTTGIGDELAIPHARTEGVEKFMIAFGRSYSGIDFGSPDGKPVKLIFLMATPKEKDINLYLKNLSRLTRLLQEESFRDELKEASSAKDIIDCFKNAEEE